MLKPGLKSPVIPLLKLSRLMPLPDYIAFLFVGLLWKKIFFLYIINPDIVYLLFLFSSYGYGIDKKGVCILNKHLIRTFNSFFYKNYILKFTTQEHKFKRLTCTQTPVLNVHFKISDKQNYIWVKLIYGLIIFIVHLKE